MLLLPQLLLAAPGATAPDFPQGHLSQDAFAASVLGSLFFIAIGLGSCVALGIYLYRRAHMPIQPHHLLLEEIDRPEPESFLDEESHDSSFS